MAAVYQLPGGGYLSEASESEYQVPGVGYAGETQAAVGGGVFNPYFYHQHIAGGMHGESA